MRVGEGIINYILKEVIMNSKRLILSIFSISLLFSGVRLFGGLGRVAIERGKKAKEEARKEAARKEAAKKEAPRRKKIIATKQIGKLTPGQAKMYEEVRRKMKPRKITVKRYY